MAHNWRTNAPGRLRLFDSRSDKAMFNHVTRMIYRRWYESLAIVGLIGIGLVVALNLELYPRIWFDEGMNLIAARNLAATGRYGLDSFDEFRQFDKVIATGPTVIWPISLSFTLFGVGLVQARAVMVLFTVMTAIGIMRITKVFYGRAASLIALMFLASIVNIGLFPYSRHALGEIPAIGFLALGLTLLVGLEQRSRQRLLIASGAGLFIGLCILTKVQFFIVLPLLIVLWIVSHLRGSRLPMPELAIIVIGATLPSMMWIVYQIYVLGFTEFGKHLSQMSGQAGASSYVAPFSRTLSSLAILVQTGFLAFAAPSIGYCWLTIRSQLRGRSVIPMILPIFVVAWTFWFLVFSIGWPRYLVPAMLLAVPSMAGLFIDLIRALRVNRIWRDVRDVVNQPETAVGVGIIISIVALVATGLWLNMRVTLTARDNSPQIFASTVDELVPNGSPIETFEWEIGFLTRRTFHYPPAKLMDDTTAAVYLGKSRDNVNWYSIPSNVEYLVDGPFSKLIGLYQDNLTSGGFKRLATVGEYDLYKRILTNEQGQ